MKDLLKMVLDCEWYPDANTVALYVHLLLMADHEPYEVDGITVDYGEVYASINGLCEALKLSPREVRTSCAKLTKTSKTTSKSTNRGTVIKLIGMRKNEDFAQTKDMPKDKQNDKRPSTKYSYEYFVPPYLHQYELAGDNNIYNILEKQTVSQAQTISQTQTASETMEQTVLQDTSGQALASQRKMGAPRASLRLNYDGIAQMFHDTCPSIPPAKLPLMTDTRKKALHKIAKELGPDAIGILFKNAEASDFLTGRRKNDRGWVCTFDWIIRFNNAVKIVEGQYRNNGNREGGNVRELGW